MKICTFIQAGESVNTANNVHQKIGFSLVIAHQIQ